MESSIRRLAFESSDDGFESCDSKEDGSEFNDSVQNNYVTPSSQGRKRDTYGINEMTQDLLKDSTQNGKLNCIFDDDVEVDDYEVLPQKLENFKSLTDPERSSIVFEPDESTQTVSKSMQTEYEIILNRIRKSLSLNANTDPTIDDLVNYYYGPSSEMTKLFLDYLNLDYSTFLRWISTIFILQSYRMSITLLYHEDGLIDKKLLM